MTNGWDILFRKVKAISTCFVYIHIEVHKMLPWLFKIKPLVFWTTHVSYHIYVILIFVKHGF